MSEKKKYLLIFCSFLMVRFLAALVLKFDHHIADSPAFIAIARSIVAGNPEFAEVDGFVIKAPLYQFILAGFQIAFKDHFILFMQIFQIMVSSISGIFLFKLSKQLFDDERVAILAAIFYGLMPNGVIFSFKIAGECLFTATLIFSMYYLIKMLNFPKVKTLVLSAVWFSIAFLTKSNIGIYSPFIVLLIFLCKKIGYRKKYLYSILYAAICFAFTLPGGLYNLINNGVYTLSSTGPASMIYYGNTEMQYRFVVETPPRGTEAHYRLLSMDFSYANGPSHDSLFALPMAERTHGYYALAWRWIRENPGKFVRLKIASAQLFIMPSLSFKHYPFNKWLFSLLTMGPVYLLAYAGLFTALKKNFRLHSWMLWMFLQLLIFTIIAGSQTRYRIAMLEPYYTIYGAFFAMMLADRYYYSKKRTGNEAKKTL